tara:strand:+ start:373 stop:606 length:234 start_codon:yes stop_codon:yes gene_type:complete
MTKKIHSFRLSTAATSQLVDMKGEETTATAVIEAALALLHRARGNGLSWSVTALATRARIQDIPAGLRIDEATDGDA